MTLTIELTPESEARLNRTARREGVRPEEFAQRLIDALPIVLDQDAAQVYSARDLLKLPKIDRARYLREAAERAAPLYLKDLALPEAERELTSFSSFAGADFLTS